LKPCTPEPLFRSTTRFSLPVIPSATETLCPCPCPQPGHCLAVFSSPSFRTPSTLDDRPVRFPDCPPTRTPPLSFLLSVVLSRPSRSGRVAVIRGWGDGSLGDWPTATFSPSPSFSAQDGSRASLSLLELFGRSHRNLAVLLWVRSPPFPNLPKSVFASLLASPLECGPLAVWHRPLPCGCSPGPPFFMPVLAYILVLVRPVGRTHPQFLLEVVFLVGFRGRKVEERPTRPRRWIFSVPRVYPFLSALSSVSFKQFLLPAPFFPPPRPLQSMSPCSAPAPFFAPRGSVCFPPSGSGDGKPRVLLFCDFGPSPFRLSLSSVLTFHPPPESTAVRTCPFFLSYGPCGIRSLLPPPLGPLCYRFGVVPTVSSAVDWTVMARLLHCYPQHST